MALAVSFIISREFIFVMFQNCSCDYLVQSLRGGRGVDFGTVSGIVGETVRVSSMLDSEGKAVFFADGSSNPPAQPVITSIRIKRDTKYIIIIFSFLIFAFFCS